MKRILLLLILSLCLSVTSFAQTNVSGFITTNTTWTVANSPYTVSDSLSVLAGVTLTIDPGVEIRINSNKSIKILGELNAIGTLNDSIIFKDSNPNTPFASIQFLDSSEDVVFDSVTGNYQDGNIMKYVKVMGGGSAFGSSGFGSVVFYSSTGLIRNCRIVNSMTAGIFLQKNITQVNLGGTGGNQSNKYVKIDSSVISNNTGDGASCFCGQYNIDFDIRHNDISHNMGEGIGIISGGGFQKVIVIGNNLSFNGIGYYGESGEQIIRENNIFNNTYDGVRTGGNGSIYIRQNIIANNLNRGISVNSSSHYIDSNVIYENLNRGIFISASGYSRISNNQILKNQYQAVQPLYVGSDIDIKNNSFFGNVSDTAVITIPVLYSGSSSDFRLDSNNFGVNSSNYMIYNRRAYSSGAISPTGNFFNGLSSTNIGDSIWDWSDNSSIGIVSPNQISPIPVSYAPMLPPKNVTFYSGTPSSPANYIVVDADKPADFANYRLYTSSSSTCQFLDFTSDTLFLSFPYSTDLKVTLRSNTANGCQDFYSGEESYYFSNFNSGVNSPAISSTPNYVPSNGLLVWYPLDTLGANDPAPNGNSNVGRDLSGNGNDWSSNGHYLYRENRFGVSGGGMSSNSSTIQTPLVGVLGAGSRSVSLWLKNEGFIPGGNLYFAYGSNTGGQRFSGHADYGCTGIGIGSGFSTITNNVVLDTNWHHIVYVLDSTSCNGNCSVDDVKIYIDGNLTTTCHSLNPGLTMNTINNFSLRFILGAATIPDSVRLGFDDFGMWDRPLSTSEILQLYTGSTSQISVNGPSNFCIGDSVTLTASGGQTYLWNTGATTTSITVNQGGAYYVIGTSTSGLSDTSSIFNISILPNADTSITTSGPLDFCNGGSVSLMPLPASGQTFAWNTGDTTESITINQAGSFYAVVTTTNGCVDTTSTYTTTVFADADTSVTASGPLEFCSYNDVTLSAAVGQSYLWSNGDTNPASTINTAGTYSVIVTTTNGCVDTSAVYTTTVFADADTSVIASGPLDFCSYNDVTLSATAGQSYLWSNGDTTQAITPDTAGTYSAIVTTSNGCVDTTAVYTTTIFADADTSVTASGPLTFCNGNSVTLTAASGQSYLWSNSDTSQSITINQAGSYSALVTSSNGCSDSTNTFITSTISGLDTTIIVNGSLGFCNGDSVTLTGVAGQSYLWNTGDTSQSITISQSGFYYAVLSSTNGCFDTTSTYVTTIFSNADTSISVSQNILCNGDSAVLTAVAGQNYLWNNGSISNEIVIYNSGNYYVTITTNDGCTGTSDTIDISAVSTQISGPQSCPPGALRVYSTNSNAISTYLWSVLGGSISNGQGTNSITVFWGSGPTGVVGVVESNGGCQGFDTLLVSVSGVGLDDNSLNSIILSPNPNSGLFSIQLDQDHIGSSYQILDNLGRLIDKGIIREIFQDFDLSNRPKGVYIIQVFNDKAIKTLNVVIQ